MTRPRAPWYSVRPHLARSLGLAACSGILYPLAQPGVGLWPLAVVCLAPLFAALRGRPASERLLVGWVMGTVGAAATAGPTVFRSVGSYFGLGWVESLAAVIVVGQLFGATPIALFGLVAGDPDRQGTSRAVLALASAWTGSELARAHLWTGLPWALLSHSLGGVPALIQSASIGGAYLVSLWLAAINAAVVLATVPSRRPAAIAWLVAIPMTVGLHAALGPTPAPGETARIRIAQGNLPASWRGDPGRAPEGIDRLVALTRVEGRLDLAVWPENAVSFLLPVNALQLERRLEPLADSVPYLLLGAPTVVDTRPPRFHNSAVLHRVGRGVVGAHDKVRLVPLAEYVPPFLRRLGIEGPNYAPGSAPRALQAGPLRVGALICYEVVFPGIARQLVLDGAEILVNLSNDAWLAGTAGLEQHVAAAVFRAVEMRRGVIRATNDGISVAIDRRGRVLDRLPAGRAASGTFQVDRGHGLTPYALWGDGLAGAAAVWSILSAIVLWRRSGPPFRIRRRRNPR